MEKMTVEIDWMKSPVVILDMKFVYLAKMENDTWAVLKLRLTANGATYA